ncbi:hypothetical protein S40288_05997 [Stachybotrys chartarum IBT 40288]|nr:hypothetical protein S40288_05997 [Stachybotrys chartarum IBT 40288]
MSCYTTNFGSDQVAESNFGYSRPWSLHPLPQSRLNDQRPHNVYQVANHPERIRHTPAHITSSENDHGSVVPTLIPPSSSSSQRLVEIGSGRGCRLLPSRPLRIGSRNDPCRSSTSFTTYPHPGSYLLRPSQTQTSTAVPFPRRPGVNAYIQQADPHRSAVSNVDQVSFDFDDGFWSSGHLNQVYGLSQTTAAHNAVTLDGCPPILSALALRLKTHNTPYDFFGLLEVTGRMSMTRKAEDIAYPVLFNAKLLLREVVVYAILASDPTMRINAPRHKPPLPKGINLKRNTLVLHYRISLFLKCLYGVLSRKTALIPQEWLAVFSSFCIYSTVRAILFGMSLKPSSRLGRSRLRSRPVIYNEYEDCVRLFAAITPDLLSGWHPLPPNVAAALDDIKRFVRRDTWTDRGLASSGEFLSWLDKEVVDRPDVYGVNRQSPGYSHKLPESNAYSSRTSSSDMRVPSKAPFPRVELPDNAALPTRSLAKDPATSAPPIKQEDMLL